MPDKAMGWCDCGTHHPATNDLVRPWIQEYFGRLAEQLTHLQIGEILQVWWNYAEVCQFFVEAVDESATCVNGQVDYDYPLATAAQIMGYFSKTWNDCPVEACGGGFDYLLDEGEGEVAIDNPYIISSEHADYSAMNFGRRKRKCFKEQEKYFERYGWMLEHRGDHVEPYRCYGHPQSRATVAQFIGCLIGSSRKVTPPNYSKAAR